MFCSPPAATPREGAHGSSQKTQIVSERGGEEAASRGGRAFRGPQAFAPQNLRLELPRGRQPSVTAGRRSALWRPEAKPGRAESHAAHLECCSPPPQPPHLKIQDQGHNEGFPRSPFCRVLSLKKTILERQVVGGRGATPAAWAAREGEGTPGGSFLLGVLQHSVGNSGGASGAVFLLHDWQCGRSVDLRNAVVVFQGPIGKRSFEVRLDRHPLVMHVLHT